MAIRRIPKESPLVEILTERIKSLYAKILKTDDLRSCVLEYRELKNSYDNDIQEREVFFSLSSDDSNTWGKIQKTMDEFIRTGKNSILRRK